MRRPLTELEGCVLGVLSTVGPCTAYVVRRQFLDSPSPYWSGSAGAIYPLLRRLRALGLVSHRPRKEGRRESLHLALTASGHAALVAWLRPPLPDLVVGVPSDPLRTRLGFLGALGDSDRRAFFADATRRLAEHQRAIEADLASRNRHGDLSNFLLARGAMAMQSARRAWLKEAARALSAPRGRTRRARGKGASAAARRRRA